MSNSEQSNTDLRDQVVQSANFILNAIDRLNVPPSSSSSDSNSRPPPLPPAADGLRTQRNERASSGSSGSRHATSRSTGVSNEELSKMFHWTGSGSRQAGGIKRKQPTQQSKGSKKKKLKTYKHTFVCLTSMTQEYAPDQQTRSALQLAGLGEKHIEMFLYGDAEDLDMKLVETFPWLAEGGGYDLMRLGERGGRELSVIQMPADGYTPEYLKSVVSSAKIFIRPAQKDLNLVPVDRKYRATVMTDCQTCGSSYPMSEIKDHVNTCGHPRRGRDSVSPGRGRDCVSPPRQGHGSRQSPILLDEFDTEQLLLNHVLNQSKEPSSIQDIIVSAKAKLCGEFTLVVRRTHFLEDVLMQMESIQYDPTKELKVAFLGESGIDEGGLKREFFSLFQPAEVHVSWILQTRLLQTLSYVQGKSLSAIVTSIDDIPDPEIQLVAKQINEVNSVQALREVAGENFDALVASGFAKPTTTLSLDDKSVILHTLCLHHTLLLCKAETDQFVEGLKSLGVLESI